MKRNYCGSRARFIANGSAALGILACRSPGSTAQFEFKCASDNAPDHPTSVRLAQMWAAVERESGGRLRVQQFPNGELGTQAAVFAQLRLGGVQFIHANPGILASVAPVLNLCFLGFAFRDTNEGDRVLAGPLGNYMRDELTAKGMYGLRTVWDNGMFVVGSSTRPIRTVEDLSGFKVRVAQTKIHIDLFKELGANPTTVSVNELYTALQTHIVDGESVSLDVIEASKFYEINKYISLTNHSWAGEWLVANGEVWKTLPADLQTVVERNNTKYGMLESADIKAGYASKLTRQGMVMNVIDQAPFRQRLGSYYATWSAEFGPKVWGVLQNSLGRKLG